MPVLELRDIKVTGTLLSRSPYIVLAGIPGNTQPISMIGYDELLAKPGQFFFFMTPMWTFSDSGFHSKTMPLLLRQIERFPQHAYTMLVSDPRDLEHIADLPSSVSRFVWNTNCIVDLSLFPFDDSEEEFDFDAVYIARPALYKRVHLAALVPRLCLIARGLTPERFAMVSHQVPRAFIPNHSDGEFTILTASAVARLLQRSCAGLMLSPFEGQNRATIEYLLSGLPVVTTANRGGRDRFLNPANSVFVEDTAPAVADAVSFIQRTSFDRALIRNQAILDIAFEQVRLLDIINQVLAVHGVPPVKHSDLDLRHKASSALHRMSTFLDVAIKQA